MKKKAEKIIQIEPWIDDEELLEINKVIQSTFVTEGRATLEFEEKIKALTDSKYAVTMTNGTVALYSILKSLQIGPGDEVIVPDMTFVATANAVILAGATPIFCDVRSDTFCLDIHKAEELISNKTRAIMPVHLYGLSAEMDELMKLCELKGLQLIEDAAQGVGVKYKGAHVGTFGDAGMLSFYGNKTITTAEGGVIITDDRELAESCYKLKNHGRREKGIFIHEDIGFNFSFTDLQAALGVAQMNKLERIIKKKNNIRNRYLNEIEKSSAFDLQVVPEHTSPVFWFTNLYTEFSDELENHLSDNNIGTRKFFYPLHLQPCYRHMNQAICPVSADVYNKALSLPSSVTLSDEQISRVIETVNIFFKDK